jgi:DNA-directed RNA polymerase subunit beta'
VNNKVLERFKESIKSTQFNAIKIGLASPKQIRTLSYGEIKKTETVNYRTLKPERDGLFCPRIFGPVQDWSCICGKYKRMKHRGVVCEKCGVEVIESRVRRERMGHIELVAPAVHIWYLKGAPSYLGLILDMTVKDLEKVIYFEEYIVTNPSKSPYQVKTVLSPHEVQSYLSKNPEDKEFSAEIGAEAIKNLLEKINLENEINLLESEAKKTTSVLLKTRMTKRIKVLTGLHHSGIRPEWMILKSMPVLPPDLRPLVQIDGGRFASSDLNELYRRVINRNIRLKRLIEIQAPSVIIKNEKRMLQESVDALIDNSKKTQPVKLNKRPLKSLSEMLRGKQGRFRQNLLGKRVDYSGRSVIVVDPTLRINQCGIPKLMALELFKSHVLCELIKRDIAPHIKVARKIVENADAIVWDVLEDIVKAHPILLNRAPTLHRLGIQAFYPILIESKAIKIHPLVTPAFNADFDGDQMGVYVPLNKNSVLEAKEIIMSSKNLLSPQNGRPVMTPTQEIVLGLYYLTQTRENILGSGSIFSSVEELVTAYECQKLHIHACVKVRVNNEKIVDTAVGRMLLYNALPKGSNISLINKRLNKTDVVTLVENLYYSFGAEKTIIALDKIKTLGFDFATKSGISFSYEYMITPDKKNEIIKKAEKDVLDTENSYLSGEISLREKHNKILQIWDAATAAIAANMLKNLKKDDSKTMKNIDGNNEEFNFLFMSLNSKARGSADQIKQLIGMRGLMAKPSGEIMETPIKSNFKSGLSVFEYFTSTHGARKGQADTALKTANAGYLTRRLVDVAQNVIVTTEDCGTNEGLSFGDLSNGEDIVIRLSKRVYGKFVAENVHDDITGSIILNKGSFIDRSNMNKIDKASIKRIKVRSVTKCHAKIGVCVHCYGIDLSKDRLVAVGTPVGIIAAQSIGEPGTQLTMRTFHIGGTASVDERSSYEAKFDGKIVLNNTKVVKNSSNANIAISRKGTMSIVNNEGKELQKHSIEYGSTIFVTDNQTVKSGTKLIEWDSVNSLIVCENHGKVEYADLVQNVTMQNRYDELTDKLTTHVIDTRNDKHQPMIIVSSGDKKSEGYYLSSGSIIMADEEKTVYPGDILAKAPKEISKTKDITGGLSKIASLFEVSPVKDPCILSEIDGIVEIGALKRGMRKVSIIGENDKTVEYLFPKSKQLNVKNGDLVAAGDKITSGSPLLKDLLKVVGIDYVQSYLVDQIQLVYSAQGVSINDRHFELIVKQMTRKVKITNPSDTNLLLGDRIDKVHLLGINAALVESGKSPAEFIPELTGITIASLSTESFVAAASFQETTRILSEAAVLGEVDHLCGLKENVIIGRLIPAGTGVESFKEKTIKED